MRGVVLVLIAAFGCSENDSPPAMPDGGDGPPQDAPHGDADTGVDGPGPTLRLQQTAYLKASNTDARDTFGSSVAVTQDGLTVAVAAVREASAATGIDGDQQNNATFLAGAIYVFNYRSGSWVQEAYIKASNTGAGDLFGYSLAFSGDGSRLAVGAAGEASSAKQVGGNERDNTAPGAGAVYVFRRAAGTWVQEAYIKPTNSGTGDGFGSSVALSWDGSILGVGAENEASGASGVDGNGLDDSMPFSGAAYLFERVDSSWNQTAYLKASNPDRDDFFGSTLALAANGQTLVVGAEGESSAGDGFTGDPSDNSAESAGAAYVFRCVSGVWRQEAYLKAAHSEPGDFFGGGVSLSANGETLAIAARGEDSSSSGVDGNQRDRSAVNTGAVYLFSLRGEEWRQSSYIKASNPSSGDSFGWHLALSGDGTALAVGAVGEDSAATGLDGEQANEAATSAGAVYLYRLDGGAWLQRSYIKASNANGYDLFGSNVAFSRSGHTMITGARQEASKTLGVNGEQGDNSFTAAGAAYLFETK